MSYDADCESTRAVAAAPSGRRMVTLVAEVTTCTLVRIVSAATKNPDPRLDPASIVTTAGETRLARSSSVVDSGAIGVDGSVDSAASAVVGGTGAIGAVRTGGGWGAIVGDGCPAGVFGAGVDIVVGAADDGAAPRMN